MLRRHCLSVLALAVLSALMPVAARADDTPCTIQTLYSNDFESGSGLADWSTGTLDTGGNSWYGIQSCPVFRSSRIFRFGGPGCSDQYSKVELAYAQPGGTAGIEVPAGARLTRLTFLHRRLFEQTYDGATLTLSLDGSAYSFIPGSAIIGGTPYNGVLNSYCAPPASLGREAFVGSSANDFSPTVLDLDAACNGVTGTQDGCGGQSIRVGFTAISDCSNTSFGWFLDDVVITSCVPTVLPVTPTDFYTLDPCRVVDTRLPAGPLGGPAMAPNVERTFPIAGTCGIPSTAIAVALNVTVVGQGSFGGYAQVYPADQGYPLTSTVNFNPGDTRSNNAIVPLATDASGAVEARVATGQAVHLILDVTGYFE